MNVDDTGWGDWGFNNPAVRDSPNLDALRARFAGPLRTAKKHVGRDVGTPAVAEARRSGGSC